MFTGHLNLRSVLAVSFLGLLMNVGSVGILQLMMPWPSLMMMHCAASLLLLLLQLRLCHTAPWPYLMSADFLQHRCCLWGVLGRLISLVYCHLCDVSRSLFYQRHIQYLCDLIYQAYYSYL